MTAQDHATYVEDRDPHEDPPRYRLVCVYCGSLGWAYAPKETLAMAAAHRRTHGEATPDE